MISTMSDLYDTCVFIDYWKGEPAAVALVESARKNPGTILYSSLSAVELWQYKGLDRKEEIEYTALTRHILKEAPLNTEMAKKAGQWLRDYSRSQRMRIAADALIVATAEQAGATVYTKNCKDFQKFYSNVKSY